MSNQPTPNTDPQAERAADNATPSKVAEQLAARVVFHVQQAMARADHLGAEVDSVSLYETAAQMILPLAVENERLREKVDKLPRTADGVPIVPGMKVFYPLDGKRRGEVLEQVVNESLSLSHRDAEIIVTGYCWYSTREKALAAREGEGEK
jgi:hypothetical protein